VHRSGWSLVGESEGGPAHHAAIGTTYDAQGRREGVLRPGDRVMTGEPLTDPHVDHPLLEAWRVTLQVIGYRIELGSYV
jgi:hypothetical protein